MSFLDQPDPPQERREGIAGLMFSVAVLLGIGTLVTVVLAFAVVHILRHFL